MGQGMSRQSEEAVVDAAKDAAVGLDRRLAGIADLETRLAEVSRLAPGPIAFSTSLGIEDQAILHAIVAAGAEVDVFTLDTGRLFPETVETIALSEQRYGRRIRVMAPQADE